MFITLDFENLRPTRGPSPMELALGISAASRCSLVYYTLLKATTTMTNDAAYPDGFQKNCDGQSMWPHGRYVLI